MKQKLAAGIVAVTLFTSAQSIATAYEGQTSTVALLGETLESRAEVIKENAENRQEFRQERRDTILETIANRVEARFARHQERLENWISRATVHVQKMEEKGKDTTAISEALTTAKTSLTNADTLGDEAVAKLRAVTPEAWSQQKPDALAAREAVIKAQVAYAQVIKDMKQVVAKMKEAAQD